MEVKMKVFSDLHVHLGNIVVNLGDSRIEHDEH
jgi:hypothetical protein